MPLLRGLSVHVTDAEGQAFDEWGVQQLRKQNKISAYIKSKSGEAFRVTVQPQIPFATPDVFLARDIHDDPGGGNSGNLDIRSSRDQRNLHQQRSSSVSLEHGHLKRRSYNTKEHISSPIKENTSYRHVVDPPFHLLASLYLDGRQSPERRVIIYLDPKHHDFPQPNGKVRFRARWTQGENGALVEHAWVFKDVGIETVFDKMLISESDNQAGRASRLDEDAMITAMNATELGAEGNIRNDEKYSVGQIVIVVERIVVGAKWIEENYRPKHRDSEADNINMDGLGNDITHTARHTYFKTIPAGPISVVNYQPFVSGEGPYATFQFFYRSQEILEKFNFPGYCKFRKLPITDRLQLERKFIDLTPLSISHPVQSWRSLGKTFEQRIKEKSFDHKEGKLYIFNQHYREAVAVKEKNLSASHVKKRSPRSNALLRPIVASKLLAGISAERKSMPSELHGKEIVPCQNTSERRQIIPSVPMPQPNMSKPETPTTTATSYYAPLAGAQVISERILSPFATIRTDLDLVSSKTEAEFVMKLKAISPRSSMHLNDFKDFRMFSEGSDADDERDASDLEAEVEVEDLGKGLSAQEDDDATNKNQDDGGLHTDFKEMMISKKRHIGNDNGDEGYQSDERGGTAQNHPGNGTAAQLEKQEVKVRSSPSGSLQNATCEATTDDTMYTVGSSSSCNQLNIRKQLSAQRLPKRIKS